MSEYHKPRITRFDFDALDFTTGTATFENWEVGQYIRLLAHAWLDGHECSLPADVAELKAIAGRNQDISDKVLKKLKLNTEGRYYNERLLDEWVKAKERTEAARNKANKRHHPNAVAMPEQSQGNAGHMPISISVSDSISERKKQEEDKGNRLSSSQVEEV